MEREELMVDVSGKTSLRLLERKTDDSPAGVGVVAAASAAAQSDTVKGAVVTKLT